MKKRFSLRAQILGAFSLVITVALITGMIAWRQRDAALWPLVAVMVAGGVASLFFLLREARERDRIEERLRDGSALLRDALRAQEDLYNQAPCGYHSAGPDGIILRINDTELAWLGYTREEVVGKMTVADMLTPSARKVLPEVFARFRRDGELRGIRTEYVRKDGTRLPVQVSATAMRDPNGRFLASRTVVTDITDSWRLERELEAVIHELEEALASIRTLTGLLPMCSVCKKIRDDSGYWERVESYISRHTDAQFSHGVCPECFPKLYPDVPLELAQTATR